MINILIISDDSRSEQLIERFQPFFKAKIRLASDFDQGLKEVFENRPAAVFIQGDISGISGETVARHIKTLLRNESPKIILMAEPSHASQGAKRYFDETIDSSLPDSEFSKAFEKELEKFGPLLPQDSAQLLAEAEDFPGFSSGTEEPPFGSSQTAEDSWAFGERKPQAGLVSSPLDDFDSAVNAAIRDLQNQEQEPPPLQPAVVSPPEPPPVVSSRRPPEPTPAPAFKPQPAAKPTPAPAINPESLKREDPPTPFVEPVGRSSNAQQVSSIPSTSFSGDKGVPLREKKSSSRFAVVILLVLVAVGVVAAGINFFGLNFVTKQKPTETIKPAPKQYGGALTTLPRFIPVAGIDKKFADSNPGWERYVDEMAEYRVFREEGKIKAIQVICGKDKTLPDQVLASDFKELCGELVYTISAQKESSGYLVEMGKLPCGPEIAIYKTKTAKDIKGFVVSFR